MRGSSLFLVNLFFLALVRYLLHFVTGILVQRGAGSVFITMFGLGFI